MINSVFAKYSPSRSEVLTQQAELEIALHCLQDDRYEVRLRYSQPNSDADVELIPGRALWVSFDMQALERLSQDPLAYGELLSQTLFGQPDIRTSYAMARSSAETAMVELRLRLLITPEACNLHNLRWETLIDPLKPGRWLITEQDTWFSRYIPSRDWRPVQLRPRQELRGLALVANPSNLQEYGLAPLDVAGQLQCLESALGESIPLTSLAKPGQATLQNLGAKLRQGYDLLYLLAHGTYNEGQSYLWLEDTNGLATQVSADTLIARLGELHERPRLIVLAACQSGGSGQVDSSEVAWRALGPRLAVEGIPAVIAMHGDVSMETASSFMQVFFSELRQHGLIDRAAAAARSHVQERPDWWIPVLYIRLKSGQLGWYDPGFTSEEGLKKWPSLIGSIRDRECTPVIGPGLAEGIFGSRRQLARLWAEEHNFPMAPHEREGLPQVSQYLEVHQDQRYTRRSLVLYLCREVRRRFWQFISPQNQQVNLDELPRDELLRLLNQFMGDVSAQQQDRPDQPYRVLAELNLPIYLTADPTDLLLNALTQANKQPHIQLCPWNDYTETLARQAVDAPSRYYPTPDEPLVYYLFGRLELPDSLVLTEDEYFNYLIRTARNQKLISDEVRASLAENTLLFLGFGFDDWDFRVLLQVLATLPGYQSGSKSAHIATQITPSAETILSPERAKDYLEEYFQDASIHIFWGSPQDFIRALRQQQGGRL
jgi:hypothetical protein